MKPASTLMGALILLAGAAPAAAQGQTYEAELCRGRAPCEVLAVSPAGTDALYRPLEVIEVGLGRENPEGGAACRPRLREFWVAVGGQPSQLILRLCNDGYGAAGLGEDEVRIFRNRLVHMQAGGSAWRWSRTVRYRLEPPTRLRQEHCSWHNIATGFEITRWDWRTFSGEVLMRFQDDGEPANGLTMGCVASNQTHRYRPVPRVDGVAGLGAADVAPLADCAIRVRDDGRGGHVVLGQPVENGPIELRALLVGERELIVTVLDPDIEAAGESWIHDDHVEIWQAGIMSLAPDYLTAQPMRRWGIRLSDGAIFSDAGEAAGFEVISLARGTDAMRAMVTLRLRLAHRPTSLTVAYSDSRDGRQHRMIATSPLVAGDPRSLGAGYAVDGGARCGVEDGAIRLFDTGIVLPDAR